MTNPPEDPLQRTTVMRSGQIASVGQQRLPVLVVLRGKDVGRRYLLNENTLVVGRHPDRAQLVVAGDPQVSSAHCRIERGEPEGWFVQDLRSTNGTFLAGNRVERAALGDGDRLELGQTVLKFTFHDEIESEFHRAVDHLMNVDDLTGLPVQRVFQLRASEGLEAALAAGREAAVFMMDLDGLKKMNDTHGHLCGGRSIAVTGQRLGAIVARAGGVVSRFGGDEFSAFVPDCGEARARELGEAMRVAVGGEPIAWNDVRVQPTISIGFAVAPSTETTLEGLTRRADEALYRAKGAGRNCVHA